MAFLITTTGTLSPVVLNDLGARRFAHPTTSFDVQPEFPIEELRLSADLANAISNGWITVVYNGINITTPSELETLSSVGYIPEDSANKGVVSGYASLGVDGKVPPSQLPAIGSGTVTDVSIVSVNGFAGTVATATTTPAITISTSVTGLLKGNGTAISAALIGTDYSNGTSALATGILKSTTGTGILSIATSTDIPHGATDYNSIALTGIASLNGLIITPNTGVITTGIWNASTMAVVYGGTGQTTYIVGDILYANTTTTLGKRAAVAIGNSLISSGINTAPTWGKIGLTTHISGTLAIANGGTNRTTLGVAGSIVFTTGAAYSFTTVGTTGQVLTSAGAGTPIWSTPTSGTVTAVSVVSTNGFAGTVATATTTPAITISTSVIGLLKGDGTAISAATDADITSKVLTGYISGAGTITATDTILQAIQKLNGNVSTLGSGVSSVNGAAGSVIITTTGTANRITITGGASLMPTIDISATYVGQTSITTLGTITSGTWNATAIADSYISSASTWNAKQGTITLTTTGSSGAATFITNTLNIPTYTLAGLGGQASNANLTSLSNLNYSSASFVKMTAAGTFGLDTNIYLTANQTITLTGDITGSGTTSIATTLLNSAVINKVLTGYVSGAGTVVATDTILQAIQKLNGNVSLLSGAIVFKGLWNASTNSPALASGVGTTGYMYKVSVAGTTTLDGQSNWQVGDQVYFNGTTWDGIDGVASEVLSVNGLIGNVALTGTTNRITVSGANVFDIAATYVGQASITTLGTITSGTWNATAIANVNLANSAITINGSSTSLGGSITITTTGTASRITVTGGGGTTPTVDIAATYVGQASITTLGTITSGTWNGTAIANVNLANSSLTIGSTSISLGGTVTTFTGLSSVTSTTFVGALTGNASTATTLQTARTINGTSFNGSANITVAAEAGTLTGATLNSTVTASSLTSVGTIATGVWNGTAIGAVYGGTGQTIYAVGDILYASTTTALSKLADVATGNALISGGIGIAPSYGKIGLTTHISGTLAIANGGTGQTTALATFGALSPLTTKGDLLTRDATNNVRVGVGTNGQVLTADSAVSTGIKWSAPIFGEGYSYQTNTTSISTNSSSGYVSNNLIVVGHTYTLNAPSVGTYRFGVKFNFTTNSQSQSSKFRWYLDGFVQAQPTEQELKDQTDDITWVNFFHSSLTAGNHTLELRFASESTMTITLSSSAVEFWRII